MIKHSVVPSVKARSKIEVVKVVRVVNFINRQAIVMLSSEKRSLIRFLIIYLSSTFVLFALGTYIFYNFQKHQIMDSQNDKLQLKSEHILQKLRELHQTFDQPLFYPNEPSFDSAIYNLDKAYIFGTFNPKKIAWDKEFYQDGEKLFYLYRMKPYYLGAVYLLVGQDLDKKPFEALVRMLVLFLIGAGVLLTLLGFFLGRLFTAPMRESIEMMDRFIEDTTHELNTPVSTILSNIELIDTLYECEGKTEMKRIEMASKTLSRLYEDLTFLKLNHNYHRKIEKLNLSNLLIERLAFYDTLIEAKAIKVVKDIAPDVFIEMDHNDAIRLLDNIFSNAIKYNYKSGRIEVTLTAGKLEIINDGEGIRKEDIRLIQSRFKRANSSEGGFGIGLDIIGQIAKRYNFKLEIISDTNQPTKVILSW